MDLRFASRTDIGRHRLHNEDRCLIVPERSLFGVADGVGGLPAGETASALACDTLARTLEAADAFAPSTPADRLVRAVHRAHEAVVATGWQISPATGIATTLTVGQFADGHVHIAHVGDSRCYAWLDGTFCQVTQDHSEMHALTRCVGQRQALTIDVIDRPVAAGDRFLFCTDGLSGEVSPEELAVLTRHDAEPEEVLKKLVGIALARGGLDNISGVLVYVG
ncbi:MAG TPA: protein phosphatase 2C domain-containing protein [Opitutaceae bacterium]|nr:protein phosphatase 2C domain-containing protein [Opitutaceae bacterium]